MKREIKSILTPIWLWGMRIRPEFLTNEGTCIDSCYSVQHWPDIPTWASRSITTFSQEEKIIYTNMWFIRPLFLYSINSCDQVVYQELWLACSEIYLILTMTGTGWMPAVCALQIQGCHIAFKWQIRDHLLWTELPAGPRKQKILPPEGLVRSGVTLAFRDLTFMFWVSVCLVITLE